MRCTIERYGAPATQQRSGQISRREAGRSAVRLGADISARGGAEYSFHSSPRVCEVLLSGKNLTRTFINGGVVNGSNDGIDADTSHLQLIVDNMVDVVCLTSADGVVEFTSPSCECLLGYEPRWAVGRSLWEFLCESDEPRFRSAWEEARACDGRFCEEIRFKHTDGNAVWFEVMGRFVCDEAGVPESAILNCREIGRRRQTEAALRDTERKYRAIVEHSGEGIVLADESGLIVEWNVGQEQMTGMKKEQVLGRPIWDVQAEISAETPDKVPIERLEQNVRHMLETGTDPQVGRFIEWNIGLPGQSVRTVEALVSPVKTERGYVLFSVVHDVSERKEAEERRKELDARQHRDERLESLSLLAGGIAHDFNNLLTGVLGNADLALESLSPSSNAYESVRQIELFAWRAARITRQMLAFAGRDRMVSKRIHLSELVRRTSHLIQAAVSERIEVRYKLAEELPFIEGDSAQLRQVIINLVVNSGEAIGKRNGIVRIRTGYEDLDEARLERGYLGWGVEAGRFVYLRVEDNGSGMTKEMQERLFDPFYSTRFLGRGLGLSAVQGIVRSHRGALAVESRVGKGTKVTVLLPAVSPEVSGAERSEQEEMGVRVRPSGAVLVVESDEAAGTVSKRILETAGFEVLLAGDGAKGIHLLKKKAEELKAILVELNVANKGARDVVDAVVKLGVKVPVILTSSLEFDEATADFDEGELVGFLRKPYRREELLRMVLAAVYG